MDLGIEAATVMTVEFGKGALDIAVPPAGVGRVKRLRDRGILPGFVDPVEVDTDGTVKSGHPERIRVAWQAAMWSPEWFANCIKALPALEWLHSDFVGTDQLPLDELASRKITFTNGAGNFSRPMAEWVILGAMAASKELFQFVRSSDKGKWNREIYPRELSGSVICLLGLGSVGKLVAEMASSLGMKVRAVTRHPRNSMPTGVSELVPYTNWRDRLDDVDFLACVLPLTDETANMVDASVFAAIKDTAWLINLARGGIIDEAALVRALDTGRIAGAVLDAFVIEPLPKNHPLWKRPNVLVLPHRSWYSPQVEERTTQLFVNQLQRWIEGKPLLNVVDPILGYTPGA